jgi:glycosyltransferase involved in cell wall biosynthesis
MDNNHDTYQATIGIPTYGRDAVLVETLQDILRNTEGMPVELIVVDQRPAHDENTTRFLREVAGQPSLHYIPVDKPSLTVTRNRILKEAQSEIVVFVDDDVLIHPGFVQVYLDLFRDQTVDGVTGQVYHCNDWENPPSLEDPTVNTVLHFDEQRSVPTDGFIGCNHAVRKEAALSVGGYDPAFVASAHCEDFDMAHRMVEAGCRLIYEPGAWLIHRRAPSGGCRVMNNEGVPEWTHTANLFLYLFRHSRKRGNVGHYVWRILRTGPWRREIVLNPLKWIRAWAGLVRGMWYGWCHRKFKPGDL